MADAETQIPGQATGGRSISSLDGLRAVSIALVLLAHSYGTRGFPAWIPEYLTNHGQLGVQIFFVISGFLITTLLLREMAETGRVSLGLFYARRTLRIVPPCYLFLAVMGVMAWLGIFWIPLKDFLFDITYTVNYGSNGWMTLHLWSLSVEEQFYLVWPITMKLAGQRRALWIAGTLAIVAPLVLLIVYFLNPPLSYRVRPYFPLIADPIAAGCFLAYILSWLRSQPIYRLFAARAGDIVIPIIFLLDFGRDHPRIHYALTETALNLCICYAIVRYTEFPRGFVGRLLNRPVPSFVGRLSYSLYLWQQVFVNPYLAGVVQAFPINLAATFGCALASYYLVEKPLSGIRKRLQPRFHNVRARSEANEGLNPLRAG